MKKLLLHFGLLLEKRATFYFTIWSHFDHQTSVYIVFFKNRPTLASFSFIFSLFNQAIQFLQQINVKNVHPVYSTGIHTRNLSNMSHHP